MQIIIKSDIQRHRALEAVKEAPEGHVVTIAEHKLTRSEAQRKLMWMWEGIIGNETGETKDEVHRRHKDRYLKPILEEDTEKHPHFAAMMVALRSLYEQGQRREAIFLNDQITDLISTNAMTVEQMTGYLNQIEQEATSLGFRLPRPEDYYRDAMGRAA